MKDINKYFDSICENYEAHMGVKNAKNSLPLTFDPNDWDALGKHYEQTIQKKHRSQHGQFFTPHPIIDYLIKSTNYQTTQRFADISCGSGRFLLAVIHKAIGEKKNLKDIQKMITGYDIDPILTRITIANIRGTLAKAGYKISMETKFNIKTINVLENHNNLFAPKDKFDCILGNPPYLKKSPKHNHGHPNLYASFVEAGVSSLSEGGKLGYIMPKSFVSGMYFKKLRKLLTSLNLLEIITLFERDKSFNNVLQEQVLLILEKSSPKNKQIFVGIASTNGQLKTQKFIVPVDVLFLKNGFISLPTQKKDLGLIKKFFHNGFKNLRQWGLRVSTGPIVAFRNKKHLSNRTDSNVIPLYWAHNIAPFKFAPNKTSKNRPQAMQVCAPTKQYVIDKPTVAIKRISAKEQKRRIEAAIVKNGSKYSLENHLNYVVRETNEAPRLETIEVLLNSKLWDYLFRLINGNTQVSAKEIEHFPLPHNIRELEKCIQKMSDNEEELPINVEKAIHSAYGLNKRESDIILNY